MIVWFVTVAVVLVLGGVAAVAAGVGGQLAPREDVGLQLPEGELTPTDLRNVRIRTVLRGYRPGDVDALLDRVASEWESRLRAVGGAPVPEPDGPSRPAGSGATGPADG